MAKQGRPKVAVALASALVFAFVGCSTVPANPSGGSPAGPGSSAAPTSAPAPPLVLTNVKVDLAAARTAMISRSGGTLSATATDGTTYKLEIPSGALDADTQVALYPVISVATLPHGTLAAAAQFTPDGLTLAYPATLTIGLAPGASADKLLGFSYSGDGANAVPRPVVVDGRTATLQVTHFSGGGAGTFAERFGAPGSAAAWPQALYDEFLNPNNTAASIGQVLKDWYHQVVEPKLDACTILLGNFLAGGPCDLDGFAALDAEFAYDNWLFALRWAQSRAPVNIGSLLTMSKNLAKLHLQDYYDALNYRCQERASGPVNDSPASPLLWAGLALARAHDWAMSWGLATQANGLDLETLLNRLCVKVVIDPSRSFSASHPGDSGTLHVQTGITLEASSGSPGPLRHDVPIKVKASWGAAPAIGNAASDGTYETTFDWPAGVDPLRIDIYASISSPNPNIAQIAVFDRITKHATSTTISPAPTTAPIGALIEVVGSGGPVIGICRSRVLRFGVGHTGANGWQFTLVTASTSFTASGAGTLDPPADPLSAVRTFRAGQAAGTAKIEAKGKALSGTVSATLTMTVDFLAGSYRDASTNQQLEITPGAAYGGALPPGSYALVLPDHTLDYLTPQGFGFVDSETHQVDIQIDAGAASGTIDGQSVFLPRICG